MKALLALLVGVSCGICPVRGAGADRDKKKTILIEAVIDGPSEPGRHMGQEEPTYINGKSWRPNWKNSRAERGVDRTATKTLEGIDPSKLEFNLLTVAITRDGVGIEKRDQIRITRIGEELSILIPDSQPGSRWYRFELVQKP